MEIVDHFLKTTQPSIQKIENFLKSPLQNEGICQNTTNLDDSLSYIIRPYKKETYMRFVTINF